eukprot:7813833-Pyramimonas_sp.AAC.1
MRYSEQVGSGITPTDSANPSPSDLDIASPGKFASRRNTRNGPSNSPGSYSICATRPPEASMRALSGSSVGLSSFVRSMPVIPPLLSMRPTTALLSPTFPKSNEP